MAHPTLDVRDTAVPAFLYGTAWKEQDTAPLVTEALQAGFRGIDTANQRKHYHEAAVGEAVRAALDDGLVARDDLFLQTKFTFRPGQDHRLPYDPDAPIGEQVVQSFDSSLDHLGVDRLDSYVLHGPSRRAGLGPPDWQAWKAMEALHDEGRVGLLGVSNVDLEQLRLLCDGATTTPAFVQNRCFASTGWDADVRAFCAEHAIRYQGFSLLTANIPVLRHPSVRAIATAHERTVPQVVFRFAQQVGMLPLTGTTDPEHMRQDLAVFEFDLDDDEIATLEGLAA